MKNLPLPASGLESRGVIYNLATCHKLQNRVFLRANKALAPLLLGLLFGGCSATPKSAAEIFVDGSGSMTFTRQSSLNAFDEAVDLLGSVATITVWRYDTRCDQLDSREKARDSKDFWALQDKELQFKKKEPGSRLDLALENAASALDRATQPTTIIFIGDGENTGGSLSQPIRRLAAHPRLKAVAFIGLSPQFRSQRLTDFAPLGSRFHPASFEGGAEVLRTTRSDLLAVPALADPSPSAKGP